MKSVIAMLLFVGMAVSTASAGSSIEYAYDKYGNCTAVTTRATTNFILEQTTYSYDDYRRCTSMVESAHTSQSRVWNWIYDRYFGTTQFSAFSHTSKQWRVQMEPPFDSVGSRHLTAHWFDYEDRIVNEYTGITVAANGDYSYPDAEVHHFTYDENGQKQTYTDPRGRLTTYEYDTRNRLWKTNETVNTLPRTTETLYDWVGNKTLVKFPAEAGVQRTQQWQNYDAFGQAWTFIDERNNHTDITYVWGPMKKLASVTTHRDKDGGGTEDQPTSFYPDGMGRPQWTIFPDGSSELTTYLYGQVDAFKTRKNQTKRVHYDARGREDYHTWDGDAAPGISRSWDDANRAVTLCNIYSTIDYQYDGAGLVIGEGDTITGSSGRALTTYWRYPDGNVSDIQYPDGISIHRDYTARGQLKTVKDSLGSQPVIDYTYLPDGKVDHADYRNGVRCTYGYDGRGMIKSVDHYRIAGAQDLSWREYTRDERDRIISFKKGTSGYNPMENSRGDRFRYDEEGQLVEAWYNAADPANSGNGNSRYDGFNYDALGNRRSWDFVADLGWLNFTRKDNRLNQYHTWGSYPANYDDDIGGDWGGPGRANGVLMQDGHITAGYNALNQAIMINTAAMGSNWTFFGYDPVGRCVKRWASNLDFSAPFPWIPPAGSNPATYFYYEGWNLIQEGPSYASADRNYVHGARVDEIVKQITPNNWWERYFHYDARGHCTLQTDAYGNIVEQYEYDAFGQPYFYDANGAPMTVNGQPGSAWGNRFLFTGREYLSDLKLYDYRNRMYQPELGRFLQPDPKEFAAGDYNLYRYCRNDPVNKSDPTGLDWGVDPKMSDEFRRRTLDQVARARALYPAADQKFKDMENNHNVKNTITTADSPENKKGAKLSDGSKGNSTEAKGRDATIYFNPDNWKTNNGYRDPVIGVIHELPHVERINNGTYNDNMLFGGLRQESEAIHFENGARQVIDGSYRNENYLARRHTIRPDNHIPI